MADFATASFTGSDGTELSAADSNWTEHSSYTQNINIDTNRGYPTGTGASAYWHETAPAGADYSVTATIYSVDNAGTMGPTGRMATGANTFYTARVNATTLQMYKFIAGTVTLLGSGVSSGWGDAESHTIKLDMAGTTIRSYADGSGSTWVSVTDSDISDKGYSGIRCSGVTGGTTSCWNIDAFVANEAGGATGNPYYAFAQM